MFLEQKISIERVIGKLKKNGFSGLYSDKQCGCEIGDLAPCGEFMMGGEYMNDCRPGYVHKDMRPGHVEYGDFVVTDNKEPPEDDAFDGLYA
jgi:hypothetical protein